MALREEFEYVAYRWLSHYPSKLSNQKSLIIHSSFQIMVPGVVIATTGTQLENRGLLLQGDFFILFFFAFFPLPTQRLPDAATLPQSGASSDSSDDDRCRYYFRGVR